MIAPAQKKAVLRVKNSLTKEKDIFEPVDPLEVKLYICGPTVYDVSHMGHARTYVSFDIIRRIMTDYFGYNIKYVMNVTDIDDKIIRKAMNDKIDFRDIARKYENEFMDDMSNLNCLLPDCVTRVSEYVPEILDYIQQIIDNGYAYESGGSVYFDVQKYDACEKHTYAKLEPDSKADPDKLAEGEGVLADVDGAANEKKNKSDFCLWKKSKADEPSWESQWGNGRPGWHIECSAMASSIFKTWPIDVHCGGVDLRFPHHDNELAQSEAYYDCDCWINHFWHTGKLYIEGRKMSKTDKNYITIKEILEHSNARQLRYIFLKHNWESPMNYSEKSFPEAKAKDRQFSEFFTSVKILQREVDIRSTNQKWLDADFALQAKLAQSQKEIHEALCDSFDTSKALNVLSDLVTAANSYMAQPPNQDGQEVRKVALVRTVSRYVFKILKVFGVYNEEDYAAQQGGD